MILFPSCKINLGLHVLKKRTDGYHEIESGMLEIPFFDSLEMVKSSSFGFNSAGLKIPGERNLCTDAFKLMQQRYDLPDASIFLLKNIPMGGGLGGGSSDAAKTLQLTNELFQLNLPENELEAIASEIGSDCPFFIRGGLQYATGRGELLEPLTIVLPKLYIVLINAGIHVPTKEAYSAIVPDETRMPVKEILSKPFSEWKGLLVNDFEKGVFDRYPVLRIIKQKLYDNGAVYAAMSGSGSTMFGLFEREPGKIVWDREMVLEKMLRL